MFNDSDTVIRVYSTTYVLSGLYHQRGMVVYDCRGIKNLILQWTLILQAEDSV